MDESTTSAKVARGGSASAILRHRIVIAVVIAGIIVSLFAVEKYSPKVTKGNGVTVYLPSGVTPPSKAFASGKTEGGFTCGKNIRQVPWSAYAPPCQPKWSGKNNGGSTYRGVTKTDITITYREASTTQLKLLYALVPTYDIGTNTEAINTLDAYINVFNKDFTLYGRKVKLVPFNGKGDFITEDLGKDQTQAQEDAVTVASTIKAFSDMSLVDSSAVYAGDLARQGVVTTSLYENPATWYSANAPFEYSPGPNCTKASEATGAILGKQLGGLPADEAGSVTISTKIRVYGMIHPATPLATQCAQEDQQQMAKYGQKVVKTVAVKFSLTTLVDQAQTAVSEMKAAGVTTIIVSSQDPITPRFMLTAAQKLNYYPEWWFQSYFPDGQTNTTTLVGLFQPTELRGVISLGNKTEPLTEQEAINAYNLGNPHPGVAPIPSFIFLYETVLQFYDALQLAGPDLTPENFEAALRHMPASSPGGMLGGWDGKDGPFDPSSTFSVVKYDPTASNPLVKNALGAFVWCNNGKAYSFDTAGKEVPSHSQLTCTPDFTRTTTSGGGNGGSTYLTQGAGTTTTTAPSFFGTTTTAPSFFGTTTTTAPSFFGTTTTTAPSFFGTTTTTAPSSSPGGFRDTSSH